MKIRMHAQMFVAAVSLAAVFAFSAPAPAATFVQEQAMSPESVATPTVTRAPGDPIIKVCCLPWVCYVC